MWQLATTVPRKPRVPQTLQILYVKCFYSIRKTCFIAFFGLSLYHFNTKQNPGKYIYVLKVGVKSILCSRRGGRGGIKATVPVLATEKPQSLYRTDWERHGLVWPVFFVFSFLYPHFLSIQTQQRIEININQLVENQNLWSTSNINQLFFLGGMGNINQHI